MARAFPGGAGTDRVTFANITSTAARSYSFWAFATALDATNRRISEHGTSASPTTTMNDFTGITSVNLFFGVGWSTTIGQWVISPPSTGVWFHIAITYAGNSTVVDPIIYLNGVSQAITETSTPAGSIVSGTRDIVIGNRAGADRCWNGRIAEFAQFEGILPVSAVKALAGGYSPAHIPFVTGVSPVTLNFYSPLGYDSPEPQYSAQATKTGTLTNTSIGNHVYVQQPWGYDFGDEPYRVVAAANSPRRLLMGVGI